MAQMRLTVARTNRRFSPEARNSANLSRRLNRGTGRTVLSLSSGRTTYASSGLSNFGSLMWLASKKRGSVDLGPFDVLSRISKTDSKVASPSAFSAKTTRFSLSVMTKLRTKKAEMP